jgi:hypothetical protein
MSETSELVFTEAERREHTERLRAMLEDDGETWDLSDNDKAAIRMALSAVENSDKAICSYCGAIGPKNSEHMADHALTCDKRPEAKLVDVIEQMVGTLKAACDRDWEKETPLEVAAIAANAIYWRDREIAMLKARGVR